MRRSFADVRHALLERARERRNPFGRADGTEAATVLRSLTSTDAETWARAFAEVALTHEDRANAAAGAGDLDAERRETALAYGFLRVARYPAPTSPAKREAYRRSQDWYLRLARWSDPPLQRLRIPFHGKAGEGDAIVGDLRVPRGRAARPPVVVLWGGIDSFKEERRPESLLARGLATLAIDMPGTADAPIAGSEDAERMWDPIFDWLATRPELDGARVAVLGNSTGGYWAAKLAHTHRERIAAAVDHGGPSHFAFEREWIERSASGEYPFELAETLAAAFGRATAEEWIAYAPRLSLLRQGLLDRPCAPLLLVDGVDDSVFPIADHELLLRHGDPKSARFFPGGHMGDGDTATTIAERLLAMLRGR
ncbi:MAG: alpha/beta hydrolase [Candidatus Limnocylindria bacterium]|nr:alpha/beta hydrolase [Candidatus Limnocylindria bacterium]